MQASKGLENKVKRQLAKLIFNYRYHAFELASIRPEISKIIFKSGLLSVT